MAEAAKGKSDELQAMRRSLRDLVSLSTLPAIWVGQEPAQIAGILADVLFNMLRLEIVYVCLSGPEDSFIQEVRADGDPNIQERAAQVGQALGPPTGEGVYGTTTARIAHPTKPGEITIHTTPIVHERELGRVVAGSRLPDFPNAQERLLLSVAANQTAIALRGAQVLADLHAANQQKDYLLACEQAARAEAEKVSADLDTRVRQQAVVAELSQQALAGGTLQALMDRSLAVVTETLQARYASVMELLPGQEALLVRAGVGWKEGLVGTARFKTGTESQAGLSLLSGRPTIVEDLGIETRFRVSETLREHGAMSGMNVIIPGRGSPYGVLAVYSTEPRIFSGDDIHFLQSIANVLGTAIERAKADEAISRQQEAIRKLSTPVLQVRQGLLIVPMIGEVDSGRAGQLTEQLLRAIRRQRAKVAVIDVTGTATIDSTVANRLMQTVQAARLLGAKVIITGLSSEFARTLVQLGVDFSKLATMGDLQGGIEEGARLLEGAPEPE
jgi:anti-anti-sigma regulatory factor